MGVTIAFGEFHDNICLFGYLGSKAKNSLSRARLAQEGQLKGCANPSKRGDKSWEAEGIERSGQVWENFRKLS